MNSTLNRLSKNIFIRKWPLLRALACSFQLFVAHTLLPSCGMTGKRVSSGAGPEDLIGISYPQNGTGKLAIVTATAERRSLFRTGFNGTLELYRPGTDPGFMAVPALNRPPDHFYPSGIDYVPVSRDKRWRGKALLYVGNNASGSVEVFEVRGSDFIFLARLGSDLEPNGVAAHADGRVFVSRMKRNVSRKDDPAVVPPGRPAGKANSISMYDPGSAGGDHGSWSEVIAGLNGANGLAIGPQGTSLIFCSYHSGIIRSVSLHSGTGRPMGVPIVILRVPFKTDNIKRLDDRIYSVCGQRNLLGVAGNFLLRLPTAPGNLVLLRHQNGEWKVEERSEWLHGHNLAPSTAWITGKTLYAGQPFSNNVFTKLLPAPPDPKASQFIR